MISEKMESAAKYINQHKEKLVIIWEERARKEILSAEDSSPIDLRDHLNDLLEDLARSLRQTSVSENPREASEKSFIQSRSIWHGELRSESSDTYKVYEVLEEYIIFRHVITDKLSEKGFIDIHCVEAINRMFELASLFAVKAFEERNELSKQKVISTLVHDIRSPIGVALQALYVLENFLKPGELGKEMYQMIDRSLARSLDMISNSLDNFSIDSRSKLTLNFEHLDLSKSIKELLTDLDHVYGNRLNWNLVESNIEGVFARKILLRVLENLISNAFKFGDSDSDSEVTVSLKSHQQEVCLTVHNWGNPIPAKRLDKIFEMFKTTSNSKKIKSEGWGLGLTHVRLAAKVHGGSVLVESSSKTGTIFKLNLLKNFNEIGTKKFRI